jgi:tetratricopeptide (TPR) repeat protein
LESAYVIIASQYYMPKKAAAKQKLNKTEKRDLDIEIGFLEGVIQRDPQYVDALQILGDDYTRRGQFRNGLKIDERLARLRPEDALVQYNLACSYSLTDELEKAAKSLERAIALGYRDFKWLAEDPDLAKLRKTPLFKTIREKMRSLKIQIH